MSEWLSGDARGWLAGQNELEFFDKDFGFCFWLGVAGKDQASSVKGRDVDIDHLDGGQCVQDGHRGEAGSMNHEPVFQRYLQTVGQEGDQDMGVGAVLQLVVEGTYAEIAFQGAEHGFDLRQLYVARPEQGGISTGEI